MTLHIENAKPEHLALTRALGAASAKLCAVAANHRHRTLEETRPCRDCQAAGAVVNEAERELLALLRAQEEALESAAEREGAPRPVVTPGPFVRGLVAGLWARDSMRAQEIVDSTPQATSKSECVSAPAGRQAELTKPEPAPRLGTCDRCGQPADVLRGYVIALCGHCLAHQ